MFVLDVIPLTFIPRNQGQIFSYFHDKKLENGTIVEVSLRNYSVKGVVVGADDLDARKLLLKKGGNFDLKNIAKVSNPHPQVSHWQLKIASFLGSYFYSPIGLALAHILPPFWGKRRYMITANDETRKSDAENGIRLVISGRPDKQSEIYKDLIAETIKNNRQVLFVVPEIGFFDYFSMAYKEFDPIMLSGSTPNKDYFEFWNEVRGGNVKLIISTRVGLFLPFKNLGLVIIDDESNPAYKSDMTPRYTTGELGKFVAAHHGARLVFGALLPSIESYSENKSRVTIIHGPSAKVSIISFVDEIRAGNFSSFSRDLKEEIFKTIAVDKKVILYVPRRGHANFMYCEHCGASIKCPNCDRAMVFHKAENKLICHHCGTESLIPKSCPQCQSYTLKFYGVGTTGIKERLEVILADTPVRNKIFVLDSDTTGDKPDAEQKIIYDFSGPGASVLIATQMIFGHSYTLKAALIGVINADALINIPDFRGEENLFRQLYGLTKMSDRLVLQTHNPENPAIKTVARGDWQTFFETELKNRKMFGYPPFSKFIKLSYSHKNPKEARGGAMTVFEKLKTGTRYLGLNGKIEVIPPTPAFLSRERGLYVWRLILKVKNGDARKRNELLNFVPHGWIIDVDPNNII